MRFDAFSYHEPSIAQLLILSTWLYLLNASFWVAQKLISAGLLGQILIGVIYGSPLAGWLEDDWQATFVAVGYIGLLLIVFEGGMSASLTHLGPNLVLSVTVAAVGILAPIGLSFILVPMASFPATHAFAAGSALSSTSLGTVLTLFSPNAIGFDLRQTRLGSILLTAAVLDDIVAFILAKTLSVIGSSNTQSADVGVGVGRTLGVTIGLGIVLNVIARWIMIRLRDRIRSRPASSRIFSPLYAILFETLLWLAMIVASGYGGTSPLYGAYIAGLCVAYLSRQPLADVIIPDSSNRLQRSMTYPPASTDNHFAEEKTEKRKSRLISAFHTHIQPVVDALLLPIFFGSIGFCIPFVPLWQGGIVWRGIIYSLLMALGKALCGAVLIIWPSGSGWKGWRAGLMLGLAMMSRGEIGLLISQIAYHTEIPLLDQDEFFIVTWAILLCTVVGPIGVGVVVKRCGKDVLKGRWD